MVEREVLNKIILSKYNLTISPDEELILPPYKGSTLRGGFGSVFRRISCIERNSKSCKKCLLREKCAYSYIFNTSPPFDSPLLKNLEDIPRPFIIEPPLDTRRIVNKNEILIFNLILIGRAIEFLPYFIVAFRDLGETGIGRYRKKFRLKEITTDSCSNQEKGLVYSDEDDTVRNIEERFSWLNLVEESPLTAKGQKREKIVLYFLTPTRLKHDGKFMMIPEFHIVIRSLLRRISNLGYFHCGVNLNLNFKELIEKSKKIKIDKINTRWIDWERYSSSQRMKMKMGGFIGEVVYSGELEPFIPFLLLGEYIHLGKGATFGMGWYRLRID